MKKTIIIILLLVCFRQAAYTTEQLPDLLVYNGNKLSLATGWGHPSPLETYFKQNEIKSPFQMQSTANYRGHIATWEIRGNKFLLKEIKVRDEIYKPDKYAIKSKSDTLIQEDVVLADWFTGVLSCYSEKKPKETYFFYVRKGEVIDRQIITEKDYKKIEKLSEKDTTNQEIMHKYAMLVLNQNYISYYFRLSSEDQILKDETKGRFLSKQGSSPILGLFENDPTNWPYNWENFEKNGAPDCTWITENNKIYLTNIGLRTGTGFYEVGRFEVPLNEIFTTEIENNRVYADWLSGIYLIQYGEEKEDTLLPGFKEFKISSVTYTRIVAGLIVEEYTVPANYLQKGIPEDVDPGLKKILEELE